MLTIIFYISLIFFADFLNNCQAEIIDCRKQDRDDYYRIVFDLNKKPSYFVYQFGEKIYVRIQNEMEAKINCLNLKQKLYENSIEYEINAKTNSLKRYLYIEPNNNYKYYQLVVDIYKEEQGFGNMENFIMKKVGENVQKKEKNLDDIINELTDVTLDEIIAENIKPDNLDELILLNNIIDEKVAENLEKQNNEGIDLNDFIKQTIKDTEKNIKKQNKNSKKIKKDSYYVIVIDAGHGGNDPGAIGFHKKTKEKNINLDFAIEIKKRLQKNKNFKVYMTREDDKFISLKNRVIFSIRKNADLFISIHSDSNPDRRARGLSIYTFLNNDNNKYYSDMESIIYNINNKNRVSDSEKFTKLLIKNFDKNNINMLYRPHKYARFAVLSVSECPSVLIELGFLSNRFDEKLLRSREYKFKISESIARSVNSYFGL